MALIYVDSFDDMTVGTSLAERAAKGWTDITGNFQIASGGGRFGTNSHRQPNNNGNSYRNLPSNYDTLFGGVAVKSTTFIGDKVWGFRDNGTIQVDIRLDSFRRVIASRNGTQIAGPGATQLSVGGFHYFELGVFFDNTTGWVQIYVDGVLEIDDTGLDTQATTNAFANQIILERQNDGNVDYDDLYVCDDSGSVNNTFLGDVRIEALFPSGNGNSSQFVGSDGNSTDNYLLVDDAPGPDDDTTYVQSSTVAEKDTYAFGDLATAAGTVFGVQLTPYVKKVDAGSRSVCSVARLSGTEVDSADKVLGTTYAFMPDMRETKPGGGAWTISDVNSAEFGLKVTA